LETSGARCDCWVPPTPDHGVSLSHEESVSGVSGSRGIVHGRCYIVELTERKVRAAVVDFKKQPMVSLRSVDRPEDIDIRGILHGAKWVSRNKVDVGDARIAAIAGIHPAECSTDKFFVLPNSSKRSASKRRRFDSQNFDSPDSRFRRARNT
jgi:hypothetical protein